MEILKIENLTFKYPNAEDYVLKGINLSVKKGEFITLCGKSGCGKTTLLRQLKPPIAPHGELTGEVKYCGTDIKDVDLRTQCSEIGFVQQVPENQIVTDKVWHELAFGLENLGVKTDEMRARVSETASFFGIQNWFYRDVNELSGGQKQLLNLAAVTVMQPKVIILDEPTAQLDPITAVNFLETVAKINRELGTTVILTEHRLEEVFPMSDRVIVMENGKIIADGKPDSIGKALVGNPMFDALPTPVRVFYGAGGGGSCPVTIREGRCWLEDVEVKNEITLPDEKPNGKVCIELKDLWFRYERDGSDILKGLDAKITEGEFYAILGGNGTGKTTALSVIGGLLKPYRGKVLYKGKKIGKIADYNRKLAMLPQDPRTLFSRTTAEAELSEMTEDAKRVEEISEKCNICHILKKHPYDLSGGEQQRLALAKILLLNPDVLLLDEPTKGLDNHFKAQLADILKALKNEGKTIVAVSHDIEFCAKYADRCAMFFDGIITSEGGAKRFFAGKSFYTTAANRMARDKIPAAVLEEDILNAIL